MCKATISSLFLIATSIVTTSSRLLQAQVSTVWQDVTALGVAPGGDYSTAIQAKLDDTAQSYTLYFPPGEYKITQTLTVKRSGTQFKGQGTSSVLKVQNSVSNMATAIAVNGGLSTITVDSLTIQKASGLYGTTHQTASAISIGASSDITVQGCTIRGYEGAYSCGVVINGNVTGYELIPQRIRIVNNVFRDNNVSYNPDAELPPGSSSADVLFEREVYDAIISGNTMASANVNGIFVNASTNNFASFERQGRLVIEGNTINNKFRHGICLLYQEAAPVQNRMLDTVVSGNTIGSCGWTGIYLWDKGAHQSLDTAIGGGLAISGNVIDGCGRAAASSQGSNRGGILLHGRRGAVAVSGNSISRTGDSGLPLAHGIAVKSTDFVNINGNTIEGTYGHGIDVSDSARININGNTVRRFVGYGIACARDSGVTQILTTDLAVSGNTLHADLVPNTTLNAGIFFSISPATNYAATSTPNVSIVGNTLVGGNVAGTYGIQSNFGVIRGAFAHNILRAWPVAHLHLDTADWAAGNNFVP